MTLSAACATGEAPRIPHHFTGKERDTESGNDYMFARYYNSATGRFLSPDWSAKEDPVPYATMSDPQSLNLYSYVRNNPLSRVDADGHCDSNGQNCSVWDHVAGAVGGVLKIIPTVGNIPIQAFNAVSGHFGGPQIDQLQTIEPDAHASVGGMAVGTGAQMLVPIGDMSEGAQLLRGGAKAEGAATKVDGIIKQIDEGGFNVTQFT